MVLVRRVRDGEEGKGAQEAPHSHPLPGALPPAWLRSHTGGDMEEDHRSALAHLPATTEAHLGNKRA